MASKDYEEKDYGITVFMQGGPPEGGTPDPHASLALPLCHLTEAGLGGRALVARGSNPQCVLHPAPRPHQNGNTYYTIHELMTNLGPHLSLPARHHWS